MENLEHLLIDHPFLRGLKPEHTKVIVGCASNVHFNEGDVIFREGDEANKFFIIRHGKIALEIYAPERGPIGIQTLREGNILGWSWLIPPYRWHYDARATESVRAIALDGKCLRQKCEADPELGYELMKRFADVLEQRLQATTVQLLDLYGIHA
jgi:CRP-like cAMP-binding protein